MRVLLVYANPLASGLNGKIKSVVIENLDSAGHEIDVIDLYKDRFDPVLNLEERKLYFETTFIRGDLAANYAKRLMRTEGLVFVFPTWSMGPPAILKGFFDRVFGPDVSFSLDDNGNLLPNLQHITKAVAIVTYGRERPVLWWFGDPPRRMIKRWLKWFLAPRAKVKFLALYNLHKPNDNRIANFLNKVRRTMASF
jgi:putative NADPH-quinone reductase